MSLSNLGLFMILVAWLWQFVSFTKGQQRIQLGFLLLYAIGVLMLIWNNLMAGSLSVSDWQELAVIVLVVVLMFKLKK